MAACVAVLLVIAIGRAIIGGWDALSADHARYVYAGLSLLDGRGYVNETGDPFLFRAPAFALLTGGAWQLAGSTGAHLAVWLLGLVSLLLAVGLSARLGGGVGAAATTASIVAIPLFWEQIVGLGVDQPQAAFYLGAIALLGGLHVVRWLAAGGLMGLGILVKETLGPAVFLLPMAWLPLWTNVRWPRWLGLTAAFGLTAAVTAGWWWIVIWQATAEIFPLNVLRAIVPDDLPLEVTFSPAAVVGAALAVAAWAIVLVTQLRDPRGRLLVLGALASVPALVATITLAQAPRNLTSFLLLTCVAVGVAAAEVWSRLGSRVVERGQRSRSPVAAAVALSVLLVALAVLGQASVRPAVGDPLSPATAAALRGRLQPGDEVVSTFRGRSPLGIELFEQATDIGLLPARAVDEGTEPADYLWLGVRRGTLFGIRRDRWAQVLGAPEARYLVITTPHALSPSELIPALRGQPGKGAGLTELDVVESDVGTAYVFGNDPTRVGRMNRVNLHAAPEALLQWLDMARAQGEPQPVARLLAAAPVIPRQARDARILARRLGDRACFRSLREGGRRVVVIEARADQTECLEQADLR
ncbi:MAG TPA: hypothetical protein VFV72_16880 [Candidatus Limnocylindrales bacterium]|nr:hypothetical protein [Candidatus Limnocylindrales bacterium]